jgi:HSP20 family molecular chaperone IbpA
MKIVFLLAAIGWVTAIGSGGQESVELKQQQRSFTIRLDAPVADTTPLFGPVREAEWAPGWTPQFAYPRGGGQIEGAVFTTTSNNQRRIWMLTTYDEKQGRIDYVVVTPGVTANEIKIRISPDGLNHSRATITYRHCSLAMEGNKEVEKLDEAWAEQQRSHWEVAINDALRSQKKK